MHEYDVETYPNAFTFCAMDHYSSDTWEFEISEFQDDSAALYEYLMYCTNAVVPHVGFNNEHFDYPVVHDFMLSAGTCGYQHLYAKANTIINSKDDFAHNIWPNKRFIRQIDLLKINHFDNNARRTSLKVLEINMRSPNVKDLPFPPGTVLTREQVRVLREYNRHDVAETKAFCKHSMEAIEFRAYLSQKYDKDFTNHNDTKLGKDYFIGELERMRPGSCYTREGGRRKPRQTKRPSINLNDVIFPYIQFERQEFQQVRNYLAAQTITNTKGTFKDVSATLNGFKFDFGTGGIHGSLHGAIVETDDRHKVIDLDVTSYYPSIAIVNRIYPEHLGADFCDIYADVLAQRLSYDKKAAESKMLKLALNGVYGDSNNKYSPFYDPMYTMKVTINGQLLLCLLSEQLLKIPGLSMVQINTDGLTVKCPREYEQTLDDMVTWWETFTLLEMEKNVYSRMLIRDVNNYIAIGEKGDIKRKGAYGYVTPLEDPHKFEIGWHKDHSSLVIQKAAYAALIHGEDVREFIVNHDDDFDFMLKAKVPRASILMIDDRQIQGTSRYFVSKSGGAMRKISPPTEGNKEGDYKRKSGITDQEYYSILQTIPAGTWDERIHTKNMSVHGERVLGICAGYKVTECNDVNDFDPFDLDIEYYITEANKLVDAMKASH